MSSIAVGAHRRAKTVNRPSLFGRTDIQLAAMCVVAGLVHAALTVLG